MSDRVFVDTNILIYAYDLDAGAKHVRAQALVRSLWEAGGGMVSTQVLQEFYVNVTRKIPVPLTLAVARGIIASYRAWQVEINSVDTLLQASEIQERHQLSFWDSMIVAAAAQGGAATLLSEDLNHGQQVGSVRIENPFLH